MSAIGDPGGRLGDMVRQIQDSSISFGYHAKREKPVPVWPRNYVHFCVYAVRSSKGGIPNAVDAFPSLAGKDPQVPVRACRILDFLPLLLPQDIAWGRD